MAEMQQVFADIAADPGLVKHYVMTSDVAGVFNFGGDLVAVRAAGPRAATSSR